jgi:Tol biopolymer transport system component
VAPVLLALAVTLAGGCAARTVSDREGGRQDPALSGNGRFLASVVSRGGRATVLLQEQPGGRTIPLPRLRRHQPHASPSLSWNGRYLALLIQQGSSRLPVIQDRLTGRLHRLPRPGGRETERLSLSPDGQRLALQVVRAGRSRVEVLDLRPLLEPDRPAGRISPGGGAP